MSRVAIYLDESVDRGCIVHDPCQFDGKKPGPDCDSRYVYAVAACVFESEPDRAEMAVRLGAIRRRIVARAGISTSRRIGQFAAKGWHATEDLPEFADPLLQEIDTDARFKGHVRYVVLTEPAQDVATMHEELFLRLLRPLSRRYADFENAEIVFEASGISLSLYKDLVLRAGWPPSTVVSTEPKGNDLLSLADYLLYFAVKYVLRVEQLCQDQPCATDHKLPIASQVTFDAAGGLQGHGHVSKDDRRHKAYFAFVLNVSSALRVRL